MKIEAQNIEEVIFDFHEGNLSDTEKAALMDFLHKHPEYEKEFALWAKSYHYASEPLPEYGHEERFIKPHVPVYAKWIGFATGVCVILATWYWWPTKAVIPHQIRKEREIKRTEKTESNSLAPSISPQSRETNKNKEGAVKQLSRDRDYVDVGIKEREVKPATLDSASVSGPVSKTQQIIDSNSVSPTNIPTEPLAKDEPKDKPLPPTSTKKAKRKRKMDLTPTDDILPFNSDF